ncbi:MAG: hypothetical protein HYZ39_15290 [Mycolicibacterium cosmeticum]|nr:hypothetical protein [Mycolicibacterium cosmeticum]
MDLIKRTSSGLIAAGIAISVLGAGTDGACPPPPPPPPGVDYTVPPPPPGPTLPPVTYG